MMTSMSTTGRCQCGQLRFELNAPPLFTHACHCFVCRRRSGSAFGLSTIVLRQDFIFVAGRVTSTSTSPRTTVHRCSGCGTTIYSESTEFPATFIVRGGTFDDPGVVEPGAHIWVKRKHPWIKLPRGVPQFEEEYNFREAWPVETLERLDAATNALL